MQTYRTVLEQKIRERRQTFEEFAADVELFAREHDEPGTLGVRHLQRLAAGRQPDGSPLRPVKPTTARLLEHMIGLSIEELLSSPVVERNADDRVEFRQMLEAARRIDRPIMDQLREQLSGMRRLDRELGAAVVHREVCAKVDQVRGLLAYSMSDSVRRSLGGLLSELCCLAGWQALDLGLSMKSWDFYEQATAAASESERPCYYALAAAGRSFVLLDVGEISSAVDLIEGVFRSNRSSISPILRSWLAAAYGEAMAADQRYAESLQAFDESNSLLPAETDAGEPYVALDEVHLARWRGHALSRLGDRRAIPTLSAAQAHLDSTFVRAETALQVDLARAFLAQRELEQARVHVQRAVKLSDQVGSVRQKKRMAPMLAQISG